ncbi:RNA polymerase sigma factor [Zunongwangia atlantica]|uniref:ECF subfamily RNA polymerase sigma-24 factor n=1 Tax=Zunongwangia atlantica 22II14-10F7 TaxID=1185767 RepID=A0A1Y1T1V6_9FLAO|nr:sigma-70 family RNA polymerase sigma factor [Zunongwangia atlantica]ORL44473.1 ECF subfamily RNA polymerase sigma-24 factor [Zunongwangia atlantica 22II14-10F7]
MTIKKDQLLIDQILGGDKQLFSVLVDRYKKLVFTLCLRLLKNREEAEEVAQDSFVKIYKSLNKFKGEAKFSTWVYRVTYNNCLDFLKAKKRKFQELSVDAYDGFEIEDLDNAITVLEEKERKSAILSCINSLNEDDAFLLTLHYYEDQSVKEIAEIMNLSVANVKVKLYRSRKQLAVILKRRLSNDMLLKYGK